MKAFILFLIFLIYTPRVLVAENIEVVANAAILLDADSGRVLWEKNAYEQLPMASTTKIMTAIVALENANIEDIVTISSLAASQPKVRMELKKGEEIKLEHLLYALMLNSFNDAAVAIAEYVSGSVEEFCNLMTIRAGEMGAYNTSFKTPSGLDAEGHFSTAYDMAIITKEALKNEEFIKIINTRNWEAESNKRSYSLVNKNRLLDEVQGAYGVKTGFTGLAGHCFVGSVKRDLNLITVVLGSGHAGNRKQKWLDTKELLNHGFKTFKNVEVFKNHNIAMKDDDILEVFEEKSVVKIYINNKLEKLIKIDYTPEPIKEKPKSFFERILGVKDI
ncbi:MAG: D-alanyl-D-alanine carboxypeptidase [Defluviitaleaceae bacterium]|nr:D-alanyl-D-alanine carboxypeptidase [Defluviitaleaceae bacterium]